LLVVSLFDGIAVARHALHALKIVPDYYLGYEIDKYAAYIAEKNWPDHIPMGNVLDFDIKDLPKKVELLIAGSPCQGFSLQGLQLGLEDERSKLVTKFFDIKEQTDPKYFLLENVNMKKETQDYISERLGVQPIIINTSMFLPQSRKRLYWTNIPVPEVTQVEYDVLDFCPAGYVPGTTRKGIPRKVVTTDIFGCLTATYYKGIRADGRPLLCRNTGEFDLIRDDIEMLPPELCEAIQGLPKGYTEGISNTQRYKSLGNAFSSAVIQHILKGTI